MSHFSSFRPRSCLHKRFHFVNKQNRHNLKMYTHRCLLVSIDVKQQGVGIQHDSVATSSNNLRNLTCCVDSLQVQETRLVLDSLTNKFCTLGFTLSTNNDGLLLLSSLVDNESSSLSILLSNLLSFDSTFETRTIVDKC